MQDQALGMKIPVLEERGHNTVEAESFAPTGRPIGVIPTAPASPRPAVATLPRTMDVRLLPVQGNACKYGHAGTWQDTGTTFEKHGVRYKVQTRTCTRCGAVETAYTRA